MNLWKLWIDEMLLGARRAGIRHRVPPIEEGGAPPLWKRAVTRAESIARLVGVIQVCSRCGTRWNVRDRQRTWCPRCQGALLAPADAPAAQAGSRPPGHPPTNQRVAARRSSGYRWIAVRPGPPPPPRRGRRSLGPTPRYLTIPRWGLVDRIALPEDPGAHTERRGPSSTFVRATLLAAAAVFALAAAAHTLRYLLLLINRTTLLPPFIAMAVLLMGILISLAAVVAVIATFVVTTSWLIARRAAAFGHHGEVDPRPEWALWAGCMIPLVNLVWAPVFVIELARAERVGARQRGPITLWWIAWLFSTAISAWAMWTRSATEPQGVADNTVTMVIAYLAGLVTLLLLWRVFNGFVRKPVDRPQHRWVVVAPTPAESPSFGETGPTVESRDREPAA